MDSINEESNELSTSEISLASELFGNSELSFSSGTFASESFASESFATELSYSSELSQCSDLSCCSELCSDLSYSSDTASSSYSISPSVVNDTTLKSSEYSAEQDNIPINKSSSSRKKSFARFIKDPHPTSEEIKLRRAKNTAAARRSRKRKADEMDKLVKQVAELADINNKLKIHLTVLEIGKKGLEEKNCDKDKRIKTLEFQLAEAHQKILSKFE
ncbi:hypothetical protein C1645_732818 [Glomus cerebriforme]|uniref:BZIP domain-containing protein n=1 Tax=Glomus cerebriforme TaxID=658196 RepID=A0A397TFH6_9GLOM|nr:hypothetical protein C1645_732818 [Glomus cerebriforme]